MEIRKNVLMFPGAELERRRAAERLRAMPKASIRWLLILPVLILFIGCSSSVRPIPFQNMAHRQIYSLKLEDLAKMQFFVSSDVVAQYQDATGTKSLLVPRMTPGIATAEGPNWIKVSFREGGVDVPFVTDLKLPDGRYWIASEIDGGKEIKKLVDLPEKSFFHQGVRYNLVSGADAMLLVDWETWNAVIATRKATEGRRVGEK
jgi:hypothetical protein